MNDDGEKKANHEYRQYRRGGVVPRGTGMHKDGQSKFQSMTTWKPKRKKRASQINGESETRSNPARENSARLGSVAGFDTSLAANTQKGA